MTDKRREKKSETLEVRLPHSKKEAFKAACEEEGITASHAVRTFIDAYLKRSRRVKLKQITEDITMKLFNNPIKTTGGIGAIVLGALAITTAPSVADDTDAKPIGAPLVTYPTELAAEGITGECKANFDVSSEGVPENITADCTHPGFINVTIESASTLRFEPKIKDGKPVQRRGVEYPLLFQINLDPGNQSATERFSGLDENGDGFLTANEKIAQAWIEEMDKDADGKASLSEFEQHLLAGQTP